MSFKEKVIKDLGKILDNDIICKVERAHHLNIRHKKEKGIRFEYRIECAGHLEKLLDILDKITELGRCEDLPE